MARDFNGSNQRLFRASAVVTAAPFSVHIRVNPDTVNVQRTYFSMLTTSNNFHGWYFFYGANSTARWTAFTTSTGTAASSINLSAGSWHSLLAVEAASNSRAIYLDGGNSGTNTTSVTPASVAYTSVGGYSANNGSTWFEHFDGGICDLAIWNIALDATDAAVLADGFSPLCVKPHALVTHCPIFGRHSPELDQFGGGDLTVTSATQLDHLRIIEPRRSQKIFVPVAAAPPTGNPWHYYAQL